MNKDQKLLEEAYIKVLKEESNLEKALRNIQTDTEASLAERKRKQEEKIKDLSQPISGQLETDEKGNFVYIKSMYDPNTFYKSRALYHLFDADLKEVHHGTPIKEGMLWTEQSINTINVYRATNVNGRLMKVEVPREEVIKKGLDGLISERELQAKADEKYKGNIDVARAMHISQYGTSSFIAKVYDKEQVFRAFDAALNAGYLVRSSYERLVELFEKEYKIKETDDTLSKDFDIKALEDF